MKIKIKVKRLDTALELPEVIKKGEWVDLKSAITIRFNAPQAGVLKRSKLDGQYVSRRNVSFDYKLIPLGVAMKLPKGFEAYIVPRSSLYKLYGLIQVNSMGIIDSSYSGNEDEWKLPVIAMCNSWISTRDRVCQFRLQLSQKANIWQKIKWFLSSGIKIVEVDNLTDSSRGGFGSTGV